MAVQHGLYRTWSETPKIGFSYNESVDVMVLLQLKKNVLNVDFHIAKYGQIVEELRKEVRIINNKRIKD